MAFWKSVDLAKLACKELNSIKISFNIYCASRKLAFIILTPLTPTFKLGFTGVYIIFLISAQKHRLWVLVRTASARTHNLFFEQKYEKYQRFLFKNFRFSELKFSLYLNNRVFVMVRSVEQAFCESWHLLTYYSWDTEASDQWSRLYFSFIGVDLSSTVRSKMPSITQVTPKAKVMEENKA